MTNPQPRASISSLSLPVTTIVLAFSVVLVLTIMPITAEAQTYTVLYTFPGDGQHGRGPDSRLILDAKSNLYGTTDQGGANCNPNDPCGTLFRLNTKISGNLTLMHTFNNLNNGVLPNGVLVRDEDRNFYGTAYGGITGGTCGSTGCGVVFKLSARGHLTVLHTFTGGVDGSLPLALIRGPENNFYGTTATGGGTGCNNN